MQLLNKPKNQQNAIPITNAEEHACDWVEHTQATAAKARAVFRLSQLSARFRHDA